MKKYLIGALLLTLFSSCEDIFESKSSSLDLDGGEDITSTDQSIYSVMGILSQMQQLGERYVLLGELRGDLMEATASADYDLQEISTLGDPLEILDKILPEYVGGVIYSATCEALASESAARRTAMNAANKNASEIIDTLVLKYNRARQAVITQEITEIVSGSEAL